MWVPAAVWTSCRAATRRWWAPATPRRAPADDCALRRAYGGRRTPRDATARIDGPTTGPQKPMRVLGPPIGAGTHGLVMGLAESRRPRRRSTGRRAPRVRHNALRDRRGPPPWGWRSSRGRRSGVGAVDATHRGAAPPGPTKGPRSPFAHRSERTMGSSRTTHAPQRSRLTPAGPIMRAAMIVGVAAAELARSTRPTVWRRRRPRVRSGVGGVHRRVVESMWSPKRCTNGRRK